MEVNSRGVPLSARENAERSQFLWHVSGCRRYRQKKAGVTLRTVNEWYTAGQPPDSHCRSLGALAALKRWSIVRCQTTPRPFYYSVPPAGSCTAAAAAATRLILSLQYHIWSDAPSMKNCIDLTISLLPPLLSRARQLYRAENKVSPNGACNCCADIDLLVKHQTVLFRDRPIKFNASHRLP